MSIERAAHLLTAELKKHKAIGKFSDDENEALDELVECLMDHGVVEDDDFEEAEDDFEDEEEDEDEDDEDEAAEN